MQKKCRRGQTCFTDHSPPKSSIPPPPSLVLTRQQNRNSRVRRPPSISSANASTRLELSNRHHPSGTLSHTEKRDSEGFFLVLLPSKTPQNPSSNPFRCPESGWSERAGEIYMLMELLDSLSILFCFLRNNFLPPPHRLS